jgi:hypothetical protein
MSSNSSSPQDKGHEPRDQEKQDNQHEEIGRSVPDDQADVPVVAVTAELPVGFDPDDQARSASDTAPLSALPQALSGDVQVSGGDTSPTPTPPDFLAPLSRNDDPSHVTPIPESDVEAFEALSRTAHKLPAEAMTGPGAEILSAVSLDVVREDNRQNSENDDGPAVFTSAVDLAPVEPAVAEAEADSALPEVELDGESTSLDASDLVIEGEAEAAAIAASAATTGEDEGQLRRTMQGMPVAPPGSPDDEFLRRVVLPPLPRVPSRPTIAGMPVVPIDSNPFDDHTVISGPPSPELLASMTPAPRAPGSGPALPVPGEPRRSKPVRLSYSQLATLLLIAGVGGGFASGYLRDRFLPTARTQMVATPVAAERAPAVPAATPTPATVTAPVPKPAAQIPPPRPHAPPPVAVASSGSHVEPARPAARPGKVTKRTRRAKRPAPKKTWVDPFE